MEGKEGKQGRGDEREQGACDFFHNVQPAPYMIYHRGGVYFDCDFFHDLFSAVFLIVIFFTCVETLKIKCMYIKTKLPKHQN